MSTIDPSKVQAGDTVTLERGEPHPAKIEGVVQEVKEYPTPKTLQTLHFNIGGYLVSPYDYTLTAHQPAPAPEWEPGTAGTATVRGFGGVRVVRALSTTGEAWWFTPISHRSPAGRIGHWHSDDQVTDFVPDDASRWAAQAKLVEIDLDNARAEAERWKAEAEMLTAKVDRLMPLQEHENECAYRQRTEKAEAEVERLRAARTLPTDAEIIAAIWPGMDLVRNSPTKSHLGSADRVRALFEQGGAS